jgi:hypothetical protein
MNAHYKSVVRKLDTAGLEEREERRVQKQEQTQQQVSVDGAEAYRRGLRSYLDASYREIDLERMKRDPAYAFFKRANSSPETA